MRVCSLKTLTLMTRKKFLKFSRNKFSYKCYSYLYCIRFLQTECQLLNIYPVKQLLDQHCVFFVRSCSRSDILFLSVLTKPMMAYKNVLPRNITSLDFFLEGRRRNIDGGCKKYLLFHTDSEDRKYVFAMFVSRHQDGNQTSRISKKGDDTV